MKSPDQPLVSVLTPVYNGEPYLHECIESVIRQTYKNFEYIIVNNKSTDRTLEIAEKYAAEDPRIKVVSNSKFVGLIENHNTAFALISSQSQYCKVVSADDWLYPECLAQFVDLAERHPTVGLVGSYAISKDGVRWIGVPPECSVMPGRELCRRYLLGSVDSFGTPSAVLYRAAEVRSRQPFFPGPLPNADIAACLESLQNCDFGFVHQILSFERIHAEQVSSSLRGLNSFLLDRIEFVDKYGPRCLNQMELARRREELLSAYYSDLATAVCNFRCGEFWNFQKLRIRELGYSLISPPLIKAVFVKAADAVLNPGQTIQKLLRRSRNSRGLVLGLSTKG